MCRCENGSGSCRVSDLQEACSVSSQSSQPSEIWSSRLAPNVQHFAVHLHRLNVMAEWKAVTGALA